MGRPAEAVHRLVARRLGTEVVAAAPVPGGDICRAWRVDLADGRTAFAKERPGAPEGFFAAEAAGLGWLAAARAVAVPDVLAVDDAALVLSWVPPGSPTTGAAEAFGRSLAALHAAGAPAFGHDRDGFIGPLPLDNAPAASWADLYAERRLRPFAALAARSGGLDDAGRSAVERLADRLPDLAGPPEPPARLHGDLWSGNVHWAADGKAWLVDPAAYGGHRESDLAMLALFGAPHLDRIVAAYDEAAPLAQGWRDRVALHQLYPLLVHAALFGPSYGARAAAVAGRYV